MKAALNKLSRWEFCFFIPYGPPNRIIFRSTAPLWTCLSFTHSVSFFIWLKTQQISFAQNILWNNNICLSFLHIFTIYTVFSFNLYTTNRINDWWNMYFNLYILFSIFYLFRRIISAMKINWFFYNNYSLLLGTICSC